MNITDREKHTIFRNCIKSLNYQLLIEKSSKYEYDFSNDQPLEEERSLHDEYVNVAGLETKEI